MACSHVLSVQRSGFTNVGLGYDCNALCVHHCSTTSLFNGEICTRSSVPEPVIFAGCVPSFVESLNLHTKDGVYNGTGHSLDSCKAACIANQICSAVDYNNGTRSCWLQMDAARARKLTTLIGVNNYLLDRYCLTSK